MERHEQMNRWRSETDLSRWINRTDRQMEQVDRWYRWTDGAGGQMGTGGQRGTGG